MYAVLPFFSTSLYLSVNTQMSKRVALEPRWHNDRLYWFAHGCFFETLTEAKQKYPVHDLPPVWSQVIQHPSASSDRNKPETLPEELWQTLYDYQQDAISDIYHRMQGCVLLADDMGLGKTLQAITILQCYPEDVPVLIVAPASMRSDWAERLKRHCPHRTVTLLDTGKDVPGEDINVCSYGLLHSETMYKQLTQKSWKSLVLDESHRVKNKDADQTKRVFQLSRTCRRRILLSGTPLNRPCELWSQLRIVKPDLFPRFWKPRCNKTDNYFSNRYCDPQEVYIRGGRKTYVHKGATHIEELNAILRHMVMIRRTKEEVLTLPPLERTVKYLGELDSLSLKIKLERFAWLRHPDQGRKLQADMEFMELVLTTKERKLPYVLQWWETWAKPWLEQDTSRQMLIFTIHHDMTDVLKQKCKEDACIVIDGRVPKQKRGALVQEFQTGKKRVALLGIEAASEGLTLTRASLVVFTELAFVPNLHTQAEARAHRNGQKQTVLSHYLLLKNSTDDILWNILSGKLCVASRVLDNTYSILGKRTRSENLGPDFLPISSSNHAS